MHIVKQMKILERHIEPDRLIELIDRDTDRHRQTDRYRDRKIQ